MTTRLEELRAQIPAQPRIRHENGMALVDINGHTVQFDRDASAYFFVEAYQQTPALEARIAELMSQDDTIAELRSRVAELEGEIEAWRTQGVVLEEGIARLGKENERLLALAREGARMRQVAGELAKRALALESELEKLRAPGSK